MSRLAGRVAGWRYQSPQHFLTFSRSINDDYLPTITEIMRALPSMIGEYRR